MVQGELHSAHLDESEDVKIWEWNKELNKMKWRIQKHRVSVWRQNLKKKMQETEEEHLTREQPDMCAADTEKNIFKSWI